MLASFIRLLGFPGAEAEAEITCMFREWGVNSWTDMACFAMDDVEKFIVTSKSEALRPPAETTWVHCGVCATGL